MGTLFLVATPIGNLNDISGRALEVLRGVRLIAAEDTRHSSRLLHHYAISTPMLSYHTFNERARRERLLAELAQGDVALITDAGTPGISDPGHDLVAVAVSAGFCVSPIPGPSALVAAVSASGIVPGPFVMIGFLPRKGPERTTAIARASAARMPIALFEAPSRVAATLRDLMNALGDRPAVVARELTKIHEEFHRGPLSALANAFGDAPTRGEIVIVVGDPEGGGDDKVDQTSDVEDVIRSLLQAGLPVSRVAREAAAITGLPRSDLYALAQRLRETARRGETETSGEDAMGL